MGAKEKRENNNLKFNDNFKNRLPGSLTIDEQQSCTYKLIHDETGDFYAGSSINCAVRDSRHITELRKGIHYNAELQKRYNESPSFTFQHIVLGTPNSDNILKNIRNEEQKILDENKNNPTLLNKALFSESPGKGLFHSDETKTKMSNSAIGHPVSKLSLEKTIERSTGRVHSIESRAKMSAAHNTPEALLKRQEILKDRMKPIRINSVEFNSIAAAAMELNLKVSCIVHRLKSNSDQFKDWNVL